ncbi:MAG: DUF2666 family protein [Candidatus Diapherotrites archaeon]
MDKQIQFISNYEDWVAIKKLTITEKTQPKTVMEFLAGLTISIDRKVEDNLRKIVALDKLDTVLKEELASGKGADNIGKNLAAVAGVKVNRVINEICEIEGMQKNEKKELIDFCKVYAMRKALKEVKLMIDYSEIDIPGMKRLKTKKV